MSEYYSFVQGDSPLLISIPHVGINVPDGVLRKFNSDSKALPDTDWHLDQLYDAELTSGASVLKANYSRYVVDLNRSSDNTPLYEGATNGLCPLLKFDGSPIYLEDHEPSQKDVDARIEQYWQPYHRKLQTTLTGLKDRYGFAVLYDAHSILSRVPRLFDGRLPDLNLGTNDGLSCAPSLQQSICDICQKEVDFTSVLNGRFKGGFITRNYGKPEDNIHAIQMEIAQDCYMDETFPWPFMPGKAKNLQRTLRRVLDLLLHWNPGV